MYRPKGEMFFVNSGTNLKVQNFKVLYGTFIEKDCHLFSRKFKVQARDFLLSFEINIITD